MKSKVQLYICLFFIFRPANSLSEKFEVNSCPTVTGIVGQDVVLPCQISTRTQPENMEVQWKKIIQGALETVHEYRAQKGQDEPGQKYQGRTMLLKDGFTSGNVSLKLKNVQPADRGTYNCIVKSNEWSADDTTELKIAGDICHNGSSWLAAFSASAALNLLLIGIGAWAFWRCKAKKNGSKKETSEEGSPFTEETADPEKGKLLRKSEVLKNEKGELQEKNKALEMQNGKLLTLNREMEDKNKALETQNGELQENNQALEMQNGKLLTLNREMEDKNKALETQNGELQENNQALEMQNGKLLTLNREMEEKNMSLEMQNGQLKKEIQWRKARNETDDITLDAGTAHPNLSIAGDKKSLKHEVQPQKVSSNPKRFDSTVCALGSEGFSSGKHYWEVDVRNSTDWDLGVAIKSIERKGKLSLSPKEGFWALGLSGRDYWAKTDPWTRVMVQKKPKKIGVYLSCQDRQVTFFSVTDMSVLFTFNECSFSGDVYPFFKNSHKETTMRVCSIKEEESI